MTKVTNNNDSPPKDKPHRGIKKVEKKPKVVKKKGERRTLGVCPICREELGTSPLASTKCGHVFCMACLKTSLHGRDRHCPTCRRALRGSTAYHPLYL